MDTSIRLQRLVGKAEAGLALTRPPMSSGWSPTPTVRGLGDVNAISFMSVPIRWKVSGKHSMDSTNQPGPPNCGQRRHSVARLVILLNPGD